MTRFPALVENESLKLIRRRRFTIVIGILVVLLAIIAWSQHRQLERRTNDNWRVEAEERVARIENRVRRGGINPSWERSLRAEAERLRYYLDADIEPDRPTAPFFTRTFANAAGFLLLPLLIAVLASDIVSIETSEGTGKLLLTRPVARWKILASKVAAVYVFTTVTLLCGAILAYLISSTLLEPRGWTAPAFTGFQFSDDGFEFGTIRRLPLWLDAVIVYGLEWYALLCVASIAIMLSVIFRSNAASMGTMLAALIAGTILTRVSPDWTAGKYLFVAALPIADYYSGQAPPYEGMTLLFSVSLLAAWSVGALIVAFTIYVRRDVY